MPVLDAVVLEATAVVEDPLFKSINEMAELTYRVIAKNGFAPKAIPNVNTGNLGRGFSVKAGKYGNVGVMCVSNSLNNPVALANYIRKVASHIPHVKDVYVVVEQLGRHLVPRRFKASYILAVLTFEQLDYQLQVLKRGSHPNHQSDARPNVVRKVKANKDNILLAIGAVKQLIEARLLELNSENRNDREAQAARISEFEDLLRRIEALEDAVEKFSKSKIKEITVEKRALSFKEGVQEFWNKEHVSICSNAAMGGLFSSIAVVCSLAGVNPFLALGVGLFLKPEQMKGALKVLPKKWLKGAQIS